MISKRQLAIISNCVNNDSSGESRAAKQEMVYRLFPDDAMSIRNAIENHPINLRWDEYVAPGATQKDFLLPEVFGVDETFVVPPEFIHGLVDPTHDFGKSLLGQPGDKWHRMVKERVEHTLKDYWENL
jgi:hypothetical protein